MNGLYLTHSVITETEASLWFKVVNKWLPYTETTIFATTFMFDVFYSWSNYAVVACKGRETKAC